MKNDPLQASLLTLFPKGAGTVVHIGCGLAADLPNWRDLSAERIYLVEPNPDLTPDLQDIVNADPKLTFLPLAVARKAGPQQLNVLNHFDLSSLAAPTGVTAVFPGARIDVTLPVQAITLEALIDKVTLSRRRPNLLVIEAAGSEADITAALALPGMNAHFAAIMTVLPTKQLFDTVLDAAALEAAMAKAGYVLVAAEAEQNPDWTRSVFAFRQTLVDAQAALTARTQDIQQSERRQTLRDNDLNDLRDRLHLAEQDRDALADLLREVTTTLHSNAS